MQSAIHVRKVMQANKSTDTKPELAVRKLLTALGYRYRLHPRDIPGRPDMVFRSRKKAIFVHGCFWHQHASVRCPLRSHPKSNLHYWQGKLEGNRRRDIRNRLELRRMAWSVLVVWECETKKTVSLASKLKRFLGPTSTSSPRKHSIDTPIDKRRIARGA